MSQPIDIILDRDGVINLDSDAYVKTVDEWIAIKSSIEAIALLHKAGHRLFVATNQSGIGRGYYSVDTLHAIHEKMLSLIKLAGGYIIDIAFCPHSPDDHCSCRKPKAGLYEQLALKHNIKLGECVVIGDSLRDLEAAKTVKASPILVLTGKGQKTQQQNPSLPYPIYENLYDASQALLS